VNFGFRLSFLLGEEFLSAPIHSPPLSGRLIGPSGIQRLSPESSRSPLLIKHRPSHLTQCSIFPFHNTILGRRIRTRKPVFKTQVMAKGFKTRVSEFGAIVTMDCLYGIFVPLVPQPQDKISNKSKCLPFPLKKEHPRIPSNRPPQQGHTTFHPQIAHELGQQGPYGAACMDAQSSHW
jgi:hypothetical protein